MKSIPRPCHRAKVRRSLRSAPGVDPACVGLGPAPGAVACRAVRRFTGPYDGGRVHYCVERDLGPVPGTVVGYPCKRAIGLCRDGQLGRSEQDARVLASGADHASGGWDEQRGGSWSVACAADRGGRTRREALLQGALDEAVPIIRSALRAADEDRRSRVCRPHARRLGDARKIGLGVAAPPPVARPAQERQVEGRVARGRHVPDGHQVAGRPRTGRRDRLARWASALD